jgi:hypothetical protein
MNKEILKIHFSFLIKWLSDHNIKPQASNFHGGKEDNVKSFVENFLFADTPVQEAVGKEKILEKNFQAKTTNLLPTTLPERNDLISNSQGSFNPILKRFMM